MSKNILVIRPSRHEDHRGFFVETYCRRHLLEYGINIDFVQDNFSSSYKAGTLRGLHFQLPPKAQAKLVRCSRGAIFDVAVDIRKGSPSYGEWQGYELTQENGHQLYIPIGFAHGFITLQDGSEVSYKCSDYYSPGTEGSIIWNDPDIGVNWPYKDNPILSSKDLTASLFKDFNSPFIYGENC